MYSQAHAPSKHEERVRLLEQHSHDSKASLLRLFATRDSAIEEAAEQAQDIETRRFQSAKLCLERFVNLERQHVMELGRFQWRCSTKPRYLERQHLSGVSTAMAVKGSVYQCLSTRVIWIPEIWIPEATEDHLFPPDGQRMGTSIN